jgi:hypothetical protein
MEGNVLIIVSFTKVPQPDLIEIVDTQTSRNRVHEYCVGGGGGGEDVRYVDFQEIAISQDWLVVCISNFYLLIGLVNHRFY